MYPDWLYIAHPLQWRYIDQNHEQFQFKLY